MEELIDFLNSFNVRFRVENEHVIADEINLSGSGIKKLPENFHLIKCNFLDLSFNYINKLPENFHLIECKYIKLPYNYISELPNNFHLIKCDTIDLSSNNISKLPDNLYLIKCKSLYLSFNKISKLPNDLHLIKCRSLYLSFNKISELPDNLYLIKCKSLSLSFNKISKLPENFNLIKCDYLDLDNNRSNLDNTHQCFDKVEITNDYIYCDDILTWYDTKKQINDYTVYIGRFGEVVVTKDNKTFAHGNTIRQAISDLLFKLSDRDKDKYLNMDKNKQYPIENMIIMYIIITGSCSLGVENFMADKKFNETISLNEINNIIGNEYGSKSFREFFNFE